MLSTSSTDDEVDSVAHKLKQRRHFASPVFDGAPEARHQGRARRSPGSRPAARRSSSTAAPARPSIRK